jgi:hypothetical protein
MSDFDTPAISEKDFPYGFHVVWAGDPSDEEKLLSQFPLTIRSQVNFVDLQQPVSEQIRSASPPSLDTPSTTIDFGRVYRGGKTENRMVRITATKPASVRFSLGGGARNGLRLRGIETDRAISPGIHDGTIEVRLADTAEEASKSLLVFNVRITTSRFWFPLIWVWILCGLLFVVSAVLLVAARTPRSESLETIRKPQPRPVAHERPSYEVEVSRDQERENRLRTLLANTKELQTSLRNLKEQMDDLQRQYDQAEREISELTSSLRRR